MATFLFEPIYNKLIERMEVVFPDHKRIADPDDLENNKDLMLAKGWGLGIGPPGGENAERFLNAESINIDLNIPFTRKAKFLEGDPECKARSELELINDFELLYTEVYQNNFGLNDSGLYGVADIGNFDGISKIKASRNDYIALTAVVTIKYNRPC